METEDSLFKIRNGLGKNIKIVAGGKGTPEHVPGIRKVGDFNNFNNWLMDFENNLQPSI